MKLVPVTSNLQDLNVCTSPEEELLELLLLLLSSFGQQLGSAAVGLSGGGKADIVGITAEGVRLAVIVSVVNATLGKHFNLPWKNLAPRLSYQLQPQIDCDV
jgi:hypothetical protein